nr:restriction endonuclease subunit S [Zhihengliuella flava]
MSDESTVSFVGMAGLDDASGRVVDERMTLYGDVRKGYRPFKAGDVLVAKITPCFENGKIGLATIENEYGAGSTEFHILRPDENLDARYLSHLLRHPHFREVGKLRMTGSGGQRRVPADYLSKCKIPLPGSSEQRRIADILDKADAIRAKRREAIAHLDSLAQSIFHAMFGDPVTNTKAWPTVALSELGTLDRGVSKHRPRNDPRLLGGPHPLVQTGDVANAGGYLADHSSSYSDFGLSQSRMWPAGTLCITIAANIAKTSILMFDACFPDSVVGFNSTKDQVEFVRHWFKFLQEIIERKAPESAQKNINLAILRSLQVIDPPRVRKQEFARRVRAIEAQRTRLLAAQKAEDELFASLQNRAFKGEL